MRLKILNEVDNASSMIGKPVIPPIGQQVGGIISSNMPAKFIRPEILNPEDVSPSLRPYLALQHSPSWKDRIQWALQNIQNNKPKNPLPSPSLGQQLKDLCNKGADD